MSEIHELDLHRIFILSDTCTIIRVPGGWIYNFFSSTHTDFQGNWISEQMIGNIFVPYNSEFVGCNYDFDNR